jgi:3-hydroxybutyryl-CoA dehydrogenase
MRIAAWAGPERRKEIRNKKIPAHTEWVWIDTPGQWTEAQNTDVFFDFEFDMDRQRIDLLSSFQGTVFINSVAHTLASIDRSFVRFNGWPGFFAGRLLEVAARSDAKKKAAAKLFDELGWDHQWVPDIEGMISPRIIAMIINEAYFTFGDKISSKEEIDIAMKLGTNYPFGPFDWGRKIGLKNIHELLSALSKTDKLYSVSKTLLAELEGHEQQ